MTLQKGDFIEVEFSGKIKDGEIFDSNIREDLEKLHENHEHKIEAKPFAFSLGEGMFLKGIDDFLTGKKEGKYTIELSPEKAFGKRDTNLIKRIPLQLFRQQNINPIPGTTFNFDGRIGKILAVSGGRVLTDFNNPLAGKDVVYDINILRKVEDLNEKIEAFNEFLFKKPVKFEVKDKKVVIELDKQFAQFAEVFKPKYKELFNLDLEVKEADGESKEKFEEEKPSETPQ